MLEPVIKTIDVQCPPETAFRIFTQDLGAWWPRDRNSVSAMSGETARAVILEPRQGGALIETGHDGTRHIWGSVRVFDPGHRLEIAWHAGRPSDQATSVDIRFAPHGTGTRVTLTHSGWEAFGEDAKKMREGYGSGWVHVFETCYRDACAKETA